MLNSENLTDRQFALACEARRFPVIVSHGKLNTARTLEARLWGTVEDGGDGRTIKTYRVEGKEPSLSNALSLAVVIGPSALNAMLAAIGYVARPLEDADAVCPAKVVADGLAAFSVIATAAADGRIDHIEVPLCRDAADTIIATFLPLSSAGGAA